jgi:2-octaprenyl-6-methoxyphenol hydroxylase
MPQHDILISGGGLVGASLALALSQLELDVGLVEAVPFGSSEQPSFDERTTAISNGTQRIFNAIGVWPLIERAATPIKRIHVSDQGRFGFARIDAREQDLPQLGFVMVNRVVGEALWRRLQESKINIYAPARVTGVNADAGCQAVQLDSDPAAIHARLLIAADGANSVVREAAGIGASKQDYNQVAIIANVACQKFHNHVAYERFTPEGPLAMLPLSDARVGVVWVLEPATAQHVLTLNDTDFIARLQSAFGLRLGRFTQVGKRFSYPLSLTQADAHTAERLAVIGNAAQSLHPIAGQGFNLGLRDAACLAEVLADGKREHPESFDPGSADVLRRYAEWRREDRGGIVKFTDGLVRLFAQPFGPIKAARDLGMLAFDLSPHAKDYLAQLSLGSAGKIPRLARGGSL